MNGRDTGDERGTFEGRDDAPELGELLRLAGRRPAVPENEIARIKAATRAVWEQKVRARSARPVSWSLVGWATAAVLVLGVGLWIWRQALPVAGSGASATARVETMTGSARLRAVGSGGESRELGVDALVPVGSELTTSEAARLALRLGTGHSVRVDSASRVRLRSRSTVDLDSGALYVDSGQGTPREPLVVQTRLGTIHEHGTQFEVRMAAGTLRIRVREGSVRLEGPTGAHDVASGSELTVAEDGRSARREFPPHGAEWDWVAVATPMIEVEGRPLREFLDWLVRERGWTLSFDDPETADRASAIILDGSIEGLTLDEALDAVLATCRLTHQADQGVLRIQYE